MNGYRATRRAWRLLLFPALILELSICACISTPVPVAGPGFVLYSPFDRESTESWRTLATQEVATVSAFLGVRELTPAIPIHLEPQELPENADVMTKLDPHQNGVGAWVVGDSEIHLVVDRDHGGLLTISAQSKLRHELSHVLARRVGLPRGGWIDEGLAHEVEDVVHASAGVRLHPAPLSILKARTFIDTLDLTELWQWDGRRVPGREEALRLLSRSAVRFLLEREKSQGLTGLRSLSSTDLSPFIAEWKAWLSTWDVVARIQHAADDPDPLVRRVAASTLPELAAWKQDLDGKTGSDLDSLALRFIAEVATSEPAARYLVYFRARVLSNEWIDHLAMSATAVPRLTAAAMRVRRGQTIDIHQARTDWKALTPGIRARHMWLSHIIAGLGE